MIPVSEIWKIIFFIFISFHFQENICCISCVINIERTKMYGIFDHSQYGHSSKAKDRAQATVYDTIAMEYVWLYD